MKHVNRSTLPARHQPRHRLERAPKAPRRRSAVVGTVAGLALAGSVVSVATPASALDGDDQRDGSSWAGQGKGPGASMSKKDLVDDSIGARVMAIASSKAGSPYAYGATGPGSFDCSGFTQYVYNRVGRNLPRTSAAQAGAVRRVSAGDARIGDLVFFTGGGGVYHVGIYAGNGTIWHAPRPGEAVQRDPIWTSSVFYGRP